MSIEKKTIDDITRTKTSLDGSERVPGRDNLGDFKISVDNIKASIVSSPVYSTDISYVILDNDNYSRIECDTTGGDITITLPLKANNLAREIEIANVKGGTNKVIIATNAGDANTLSNDALSVIWLPKVGDFVKFRESQTSGYWEVSNERITSQLRLNVMAGYGNASNDKIPYFTNTVENIGNCHTLTSNNNATGCVITINRSGKYCFSFSCNFSVATNMGISLNSNQLTTPVTGITSANVLSLTTNSAANYASESNATIFFTKGDIVRPHTDGVSAGTREELFTCSYLGN